ncbi:hypothetical protein QDY71_06700 [Kingella negevensis]|uniref:Uncharacterized protein n=1 Tax=Kingella negevensis TaxID=1522312 RepID=A0A238HHZ4_9NEIS|nr:hypothetical protein [Kingella negevensis]MDK4681355.1 hypothetical protein [Kingella negevensis]MDK4683552.1 hypothetical protein [Kingella negevensis]MDK4685594.1 hypothetical protein [Kingella negevensis]MDK4691313.1 hypothetical protein [Kingella negevensis]MDK4693538.1 hypothetical protein [Kingella negevensis]
MLNNSIFEKQLNQIQIDLIELALEYAKYTVDTVYIYGSNDHNSLFFNEFFKEDGVITEKHKLKVFGSNFAPVELQMKFLDLGMEDFKDLRKLFEIYQGKTLTQLKLVYDVVNKKAHANYSYDSFLSDKIIADHIFNQWIENERNINKIDT